MDEEKTLDELWEAGTQETDAESVATDAPIPDDDSDVLGDEPESEDEDVSASEPEKPYGLEAAQLQAIEKYFNEKVLPAREEAWLREAQKRARQGEKEQDKRIKEQLAPLVDQYKRLEEQGLFSREDSQREYAAAYQKVQQDIEAKENQQAEAELRQRWLAQSQGNTQQAPQSDPDSYERVKQIASTEVTMQNILNQSGLTDADPELQSVPLKITHEDAKEALDYFAFKVATAVKTKEQRVKASAKAKPFIDMGTGGGSGAGNPLSGIEDTDTLWELAMRS